MNHLKRICIWGLVLALFLLLPVSASAADSGTSEAVARAIISGYESMETQIDLTVFEITGEELGEIYCTTRDANLLPWYAAWYSYNYYPSSGLVTSITLKYFDPEVYDYSLYEQTIQKILDETVFPGMSQWQIALSIHDYLAANYRYDESKEARYCPDLILNGTSVCNGYARAYMDLLKRAGLEAVYVTSDGMNHGWNLVKIGSDWYHVDTTWDDPVADCYGRVQHGYFLLDDETIADEEHEHYDWVAPYTAENKDMSSNVFWQGINSQICYESSSVSYLRMDKANEHWIYRRDETTGKLTELAYFDAGYLDIGQGSYHYGNYGLSLWNGRLYFSDMEQVYAMNTDGSGLEVLYTHDAEAAGTYINGSLVRDGMLCLTFSNHEKVKTHLELPLPGWENPAPEETVPALTFPAPESGSAATEPLSAPSGDEPVSLPELPNRTLYISILSFAVAMLSLFCRKRHP